MTFPLAGFDLFHFLEQLRMNTSVSFQEQACPTPARPSEDFDDVVVDDDDDLEQFSETPEPTQVTALLSRNAQDDTDTMLKLQDNFQKRFVGV